MSLESLSCIVFLVPTLGTILLALRQQEYPRHVQKPIMCAWLLCISTPRPLFSVRFSTMWVLVFLFLCFCKKYPALVDDSKWTSNVYKKQTYGECYVGSITFVIKITIDYVIIKCYTSSLLNSDSHVSDGILVMCMLWLRLRIWDILLFFLGCKTKREIFFLSEITHFEFITFSRLLLSQP